MSAPEFSRPVDLREIGDAPLKLLATPQECAALAARFALVRLDRLEASVSLEPKGARVEARGRLSASWVQSCAISGEDLAQSADEDFVLRFVPAPGKHAPDEEIELSDSDCDEIEYSGTSFDVGEAVAQSLGLAIDPFAAGPQAEQARQRAGIVGEAAGGAFGALAGLKLPEKKPD